MKKLILIVVVFLALLGAFSVGMVAWILSSRHTVQARTWLELDLGRPPVEYLPDDPLAVLLHRRRARLLQVVEAIDRASRDGRVEGLVARVGGGRMGLATAEELRQAVSRFRQAGKRTVAWGDTFGEWNSANASYYVASAFEKIYLQPSGDVGLTGLAYMTPFVRGTLDKLGVEPEMGQRYEYKNAVNSLTHTAFTGPHREALQGLMQAQFDQMVTDIAASRKLDPAQLRATIDGGPLLGQEAVDAGLVDGLKYRDQVYDEINGNDSTSVHRKSPAAYLRGAGRLYNRGTKVALIYGVGEIHRGESAVDALTGSISMGSETVARAFRTAIDDDSVKAIVFRVNSPGGSYVASDTVWREVERARAKGKPVVVSMGDLAASGGYFIAAGADRIVAQPGTITGSIGVFGGKLVTQGLWNKLGVTFDEVHTSDDALMWSSERPYTPAQWQRVQDSLDRIYVDFTSKVAQGRKLPLDRVKEVARGRVWSGTDALRLKLVDALGGYDTALAQVREVLKLPQDAPLRVRMLPRPESRLQALLDRVFGDTSDAGVDGVRQVLEAVRPLAQLARKVGLLQQPESDVLRAPNVDSATVDGRR
jgi:protease-4